jgi:hypothetical protein
MPQDVQFGVRILLKKQGRGFKRQEYILLPQGRMRIDDRVGRVRGN